MLHILRACQPSVRSRNSTQPKPTDSRYQPSPSRRADKASKILHLEDPFKYGDLPDHGSLRVLELKPGQASDPLVVFLQTIRDADVVRELARTTALSYVWGDPTRCRTISCNKKSLQITVNLEKALKAIRLEHAKIQIWADAVCINQDNALERNHQIKLMTRIYSCSKQVLVWLGHCPDAEPTIQYALQMANVPHHHSEDKHPMSLYENGINALRSIQAREWFNRMWTMQEIGLATNAIFLLGSKYITWNNLWAAYQKCQMIIPRSYVGQFFDPDRVVCLKEWNSTNSAETFLQLLVMTQERKATDPRDRVFALLSHPSAQMLDPSNGSTSLVVEPDYTRDVREIYTDVAARIISTSRRLDVLSYVRGNEREVGLPSWAPCWSQQKESQCLLDNYVEFAADGANSMSTRWKQNKHEAPPLSADEIHLDDIVCGNELSVLALDIGKVVWCLRTTHLLEAQPDRDDKDRKERSLGIARAWRQIKEVAPKQPEIELARAFNNALTCGPLHPQYHFVGGEHLYADRVADHWRCLFNGEPEAEYYSDVKSLNSSLSPWYFRVGIRYAGAGRSLFCTNTGFIGLGPDSITIGDEACILRGARVPSILRAEGCAKHKLVGECYISGTMHGEMAPQTEADSARVTRKTLV